VDLGGWLIAALGCVGLAWDIKRVRRELQTHLRCDPLEGSSSPQPKELDSVPTRGKETSETGATDFRGEVHTAVLKWLRAEVAPGIEAVDYNTPLTAQGLDSVGVAVVALELERATGIRLGPDVIYEHATIDRLGDYLVGRSALVRPHAAAVGHCTGEGNPIPAHTIPQAKTAFLPSLPELLDSSLAGIQAGEMEDAVWGLVSGLRSIRATAATDEWAGIIATCLAHPIRQVLHEDPYTRRGFLQPRGYPGDAVLIDYLYLRGPSPGEAVTELGLALHRVAVRTPAGYSVRSRRDFAARIIDKVADRVSEPAVLSVGCGHLREAGRSRAVRDGRLGRFLAIDQDPESVRVAANDWSGHGVEARCLSATEMIQCGDSVGRFHLVYALGLYDYLTSDTARLLTRHLFDLLLPGGALVVANFVPGGLEAGYMEAFMRWHLLYRTPEELRPVSELVPPAEVASCDVWLEDAGNIAYLRMVRC
jgi:hypothetical protein